MAKIIKHYAASLFRLAKERGMMTAIYKEAKLLTEASDHIKESLNLSPEMSSFISFVLENDIEPVIHAFIEMARGELGILSVEITSAFQLSIPQQVSIASRLEVSTGKEIELLCMLDESLIGGIKISAGEKMLDFSVKTQLDQMKTLLYSGVSNK